MGVNDSREIIGEALRRHPHICSGSPNRAGLHGVRQRTHRQNGRKVRGHQQFRCRACGACRVLHPKSNETAPEREADVLRAVETERLSLRAAQRVFGVSRGTFALGLQKKAESFPPLSDTLLPAEAGDALALDERWSFVGSGLNARWVWIAFCRPTRQVVAYFVGDRSAESARARRERIPLDHRSRATRSDFWLAYDEAFPRRTHRSGGKEEGETCHVERRNCTLRQRPGRFVRKILSFSKCERMHELALRLFVHRYNQQPVIWLKATTNVLYHPFSTSSPSVVGVGTFRGEETRCRRRGGPSPARWGNKEIAYL